MEPPQDVWSLQVRPDAGSATSDPTPPAATTRQRKYSNRSCCSTTRLHPEYSSLAPFSVVVSPLDPDGPTSVLTRLSIHHKSKQGSRYSLGRLCLSIRSVQSGSRRNGRQASSRSRSSSFPSCRQRSTYPAPRQEDGR